MIHFKKMTRLLCGILIIAGCISCSTSTSGGESTENTNENTGNNGGNTENTNENSGNSGGNTENTNENSGNNGGNTQPDQNSQKYTVTYETRFGDVEKITVTENTVLTEKELPVFSEVRYYYIGYDYKEYFYVFDGWYDGDTLALAGSYKVTKDVTLVAKWTKTYRVHYWTAHGTAPDEIWLKENTVLTSEHLPEITTEDGYIFDGWYDGDTLALAGSYKVTKDVTLEAKWTKTKTYSVSYWTAHGTAPNAIWLKENTVLTSEHLPEITTEDGYIFDGWYTSTSYNDDYKVLADSYTLTDYICLYAKWVGASSVTAELINDDTEISITAEQNGSLWTLTADEGFENYVWRIEGEVQTNAESASLEVDTATWAKGLYEVTVEAEKNGAFYSARVYITAGGNE